MKERLVYLSFKQETHQHLLRPCSSVQFFLPDIYIPMGRFHNIPHSPNMVHKYHNSHLSILVYKHKFPVICKIPVNGIIAIFLNYSFLTLKIHKYYIFWHFKFPNKLSWILHSQDGILLCILVCHMRFHCIC